MPSLTFSLLAWLDAHPGRALPVAELNKIPPVQWEAYFDDLAPICPARVAGEQADKQRNALRIEILPTGAPRCAEQSPDGRGRAWLWSGGSPTAYGLCWLAGCPRARDR